MPTPRTVTPRSACFSVVICLSAALTNWTGDCLASDRLPDEMQNPNDVHFNAAGYEFLGQRVGEAIEEVLK